MFMVDLKITPYKDVVMQVKLLSSCCTPQLASPCQLPCGPFLVDVHNLFSFFSFFFLKSATPPTAPVSSYPDVVAGQPDGVADRLDRNPSRRSQ